MELVQTPVKVIQNLKIMINLPSQFLLCPDNMTMPGKIKKKHSCLKNHRLHGELIIFKERGLFNPTIALELPKALRRLSGLVQFGEAPRNLAFPLISMQEEVFLHKGPLLCEVFYRFATSGYTKDMFQNALE